MNEFKLGDEYWTFQSDAEIYGDVYWPFIKLEKTRVLHKYQEKPDEQEFYFKTKNEAIDWIVNHFERMRNE